MCAPSPPPAPNYQQAAVAQGAANLEAAKTQGKLNNPNVYSPYGSQTVSFGFDQAGFDSALNKYNQDIAKYRTLTPDQQATTPLPQNPYESLQSFQHDADQPTVRQTLSPEQQALYEKSNTVKGLLGDLGIEGAKSLEGIVGKPIDYSGAPAAPGSATDTRNKVIDAMMSRVNEDTGIRRDDLNSNLVAAGIRPGTKAYDDQMRLVDRAYNDARNQALLASGQEMSRDFQTDTQRRKDAIAEYLAQRQTPLNEINALMSGSQVSNPFAMPGYAQNTQVAPAPVFGATQAGADYSTGLYNAQMGYQGNLMKGLFDLGGIAGGAAIMKSDRRLKSHVQRIGTHPLGIGWYRYVIDGRQEEGVMADEVLTVRPEAVVQRPDGYYMVNYGALR